MTVAGSSILQHIRRTLAQAIASADVGERRPRISVPREVLKVDDVGSAFAGRRERGDSKRVDGDGRIKAEPAGVLLHAVLGSLGARGELSGSHRARGRER